MEELIQAKQDKLKARMERVSMDALRAMASMQTRPLPFLTSVDSPDTPVAIVGQVHYERPQTGDLTAIYDPVQIAKSYVNAGVDAISLFTDSVIEYDGTIDLTLINDAMQYSQTPVISQNYIIHEYQIVEARAAGASVILLTAGIISMDRLRLLTSAVHRNRMTAVVEVFSEDQLEQVLQWSPQVIGLSRSDITDTFVDLKFVREMRKKLPYGQQVMVTQPLVMMDGVKEAHDIGVHAITVSEHLMMNPGLNDELHIALNHA